MQKNKFTTYLLYAVGEIVLVVIGILIAVSINNWNDDRKKTQSFDELALTLESKIEQNLDEYLQYEEDFLEEIIPMHDYLLNAQVEENGYPFTRGIEAIKYSATDYTHLNFESLEQLKDLESFATEKYQPLLRFVVEFEFWKSEYKSVQVSILETLNQFDSYLLRNMDSYSNDDPDDTFKIKFYSKDKAAKNFIYKLRELRTRSHFTLSAVYSSLYGLLASIKTAQGFNTNQLVQYLAQRGFSSAHEYTCDKDDFNRNAKNVFFSLYYNSTDEVRNLERLGNQKNYWEAFSIQPKSFLVFGHVPGLPIQVLDDEGECKDLFVFDRYGFVLLD